MAPNTDDVIGVELDFTVVAGRGLVVRLELGVVPFGHLRVFLVEFLPLAPMPRDDGLAFPALGLCPRALGRRRRLARNDE